MKKLEKLEIFKLQNEKLNNIFGGKGGPASPTFGIEGNPTGAGSVPVDIGGQCVCMSYSGDCSSANGGIVYYNPKTIEGEPCN